MSLLAYQYDDEYLSKLMTVERETQAISDVADIGTFPAPWVERLAIQRAYILVCMQSQRTTDDLFSIKLRIYKSEFDRLLPLARAAQDSASPEPGKGSIMSIPLERS
jgi:hypothetical protein